MQRSRCTVLSGSMGDAIRFMKPVNVFPSVETILHCFRLDATKPRSLLPIADPATDWPFKSRQNAGRAYPPAPARDRDHLLPTNGDECLRFAGARAKRSW